MDDVNATATKWADAMRRAAEIERAERPPSQALEIEAFVRRCYAACGWVPDDAGASIAAFLHAGLSFDDLEYALDEAHIKGRPFRYFAGICWTIVRRRSELAMKLMEGGR